LTTTFAHLDVVNAPRVVRFKDRQAAAVAINVLKPAPPLVSAALKNVKTVRTGRLTYKVPTPEMALALTFDKMVSPYRDGVDKCQDAADFGRIVVNNPEIDLNQLADLGELAFSGGGRALVTKVHRVRADARPVL
jgi:hypothetical protein